MNAHKLHLTTTDPGRAKVLLDGHDISRDVSGIAFNASAGDAPTATIEVVAAECEIDAENVRVELSEASRQLLTKAGYIAVHVDDWTSAEHTVKLLRELGWTCTPPDDLAPDANEREPSCMCELPARYRHLIRNHPNCDRRDVDTDPNEPSGGWGERKGQL